MMVCKHNWKQLSATTITKRIYRLFSKTKRSDLIILHLTCTRCGALRDKVIDSDDF